MQNVEINKKAKELKDFLDVDVYTPREVRNLLKLVNDNDGLSSLISVCSEISKLEKCVDEMQHIHDTLYSNLDVENAALDMIKKLDEDELSFLEARNDVLENFYY